MTLSQVLVACLGQQMIVVAVIVFLSSTTVESFVAPFSPSQEQRQQQFTIPSLVKSSTSTRTRPTRFSTPISSHQLQIPTRTRTTVSTTLFATSIGDIQIPSSKLENDDAKEEAEVGAQNELSSSSVSKFRQLKDVMWIRETLEDWTTSEFALSVEQQSEGTTVNGNGGGNLSKKRAVDYEKLLSQLTKRIEDMTCKSFAEDWPLVDDDGVLQLNENLGMGRYAYTNEERMILLERILKTRINLSRVLESNDLESEGSSQEGESSSSFLKQVKVPELPDLVATPEDNSTTADDPKLYVRDDGTVDWEGALQDRAALRKFGGAVWARINGQTPDDLEDEPDGETTSKEEGGNVGGADHSKPAVTAKIEDTPAIQEARNELVRLKNELKEDEKAHTTLVASGISAGQAVANVKLASLDPVLRNEIRRSAEALIILEQQVSYQNLVYELERIYTYLLTELGNPTTKGYIPLQDRLNVAEYGLLESQVESCSRELNSKGVLDADILAVIAEQMIDFKRRLGIDYYVAGLTYDREAIIRWLNDLYISAKAGIMFYVKGTRLFWNDVVYCASLIGRAAQGVTLKPREVRTIRRTFKDVITFVPVMIILIAPLTPVGHVLIFGAIQRFIPGFFPSCFTEQRQNLLQLYETTEFSEVTIKETFQERLNRFLEALVYSIVNKTRNAYKQLTNTYSDETDINNNGSVEEKSIE